MNLNDIPDKTTTPVFPEHFPTAWQAVLWRNSEFASAGKLAQLLECTETEIRTAAREMGLPLPRKVLSKWKNAGYLTIIRNNWHLLNYEQLLELLEWTPAELAHTLREEDFLWGKLGAAKPVCERVRHTPLTEEQKRQTEQLRKFWQSHIPPEEREYAEKPFTFAEQYPDFTLPAGKKQRELQFIHSYAANCGDLLMDLEKRDPMPEILLRRYAALGIDGIWIHAILYQLHPVAGSEKYSAGYEQRLKHLAILSERCRKYGIKIYLYLNEPRGMTDEFYRKNPEWRGVEVNPARKEWSNCVSCGSVLPWMEEALFQVFTKVPQLGGVFLITMSENPTHCNAQHKKSQCPFCRDRDGADLLAEIAATAERGVHRASPDAKVLMSDWAWSETGLDPEAVFRKRVIDKLPRNVWFLSISEWGKDLDIGGIPNRLYDYSISQPGPSAESAAALLHARERGLKTAAKVQINNSWELAAVPWIPVPHLIAEHLKNLSMLNIDGLMLSWTHGGYPGGNLQFLTHTPADVLESVCTHSDLAGKIHSAFQEFSRAFREFPFDVMTIYTSPVNSGPMNLLHRKPTAHKASMIGYPYDDLTTWRSVYPEDVFESQFAKLCSIWNSGLIHLEQAQTLPMTPQEKKFFQEVDHVSQASYCHFFSTLQQIRFVRAREQNDRVGMVQAIRFELETVKRLHFIARRDSRIGFESSNHYFYTRNDLFEKIINCETLLKQLTVAEHPSLVSRFR